LVHYNGSEQQAREVVQIIESQGSRAWAAQADLSKPDEVTRLVKKAHELLGAIDVWINNAGASANSRETRGMDEVEVFERMMQVDTLGTWRCCREVERYMQDGGCILTTGWDGALASAAGLPNQMYAMSKGAIIALTRCLAVEFAPRVRVNCIAPGHVENDWSRGLNEQARQRLVQHVPMQRWGTADDILGIALFLASPAAAYITGQVMLVNGGEIMR
ncbi:MAG TPA: SDR family oxidoreductase, partial [Ktedonobacteraceae bacterium]|nr:SDR family oxidoreductase [Ktedonobacteraceae bacterium]